MRNTYFSTKKRLFAMFVAIAFIFFVIFLRLGYIQIVWGKKLQTRALEQWTRDLPVTADRGDITDTNGIVFASSGTSYTVYVRPNSVSNHSLIAELLSQALKLSYQDVYDKVTAKISENTIKRKITVEEANLIRSYNLEGVYLAADTSREYVYGDFLSQVLGFVSSDNTGQSGLEAYYDKYLRGVDGAILTPSDLVGKELEGESAYYTPPVSGLNVVTTIDFRIQRVVENVLDLVMQGHSPKGARCIVVNPQTGEVLAMSSKPSVDLNNLPRDNIGELMASTKNMLITDVYEPGSTFKVLTAAAMLEEYARGNPKAHSASYVFPNNANFRIVDGSRVKCWTTHTSSKHCNQNLGDALNNSCNPIFTDIGLSLGKETMYKYLSAFGYGAVSGIDFAGEQAGLLVAESAVTNGDLARISFGQTIAVTPLQLAMATSAAVNGGLLMQPYLVKEIRTQEGELVKKFYPTVRQRAISEKVSRELAGLLENVVTNGSGKQAYIEGFKVGGKTGTAQKYENGHIAVGKYVSSFVGFFPADNPQYLALMLVDEPTGAHYGSTVAAPYAKMIFQQIINYKNLKPA